MRPSFSLPSRSGASFASSLDSDDISDAASLAGVSWQRVPSVMPSGASPLVQMSGGEQGGAIWIWRGRGALHSQPLYCCCADADVALLTRKQTSTVHTLLTLRPSSTTPCPAVASFRQQQERGGVLDLPAGTSAVPLHLAPHLPNHTLSFRCVPPPAYAAAAAADSLPLWSRPVTVREGVETQLHVVVPVIQPMGEQQQQEEEEGQEGGSGGTDAAHLTATSSADTAHLTAAAAAARGGVAAGRRAAGVGGAPALTVAILRLSVHRRGPGAMHVVLESMQGDPPYLLENRMPIPLQYRQVRTGREYSHAVCACTAAALPSGIQVADRWDRMGWFFETV